MVNLSKVETEAKQIIAETESAASGILGTISPQWNKFVALWQSWSLRKKIIGATVIAFAAIVLWAFSVDLGRLVVGGYRSAYTYGRGLEVTSPEVKGDIANALKGAAAKADVIALASRVAKLESELKSIDDKIDQASAPKTAFPAKRKKSVAKASSSFFQFP